LKPLIDILEQYWGFSSFRPSQEAIITSVLNGRDTVALLPTGGGKSLCYQLPALAMEGICLVISPLIALMDDQVSGLHEKGIRALKLTGGISHQELQTLLDNARYGNYKFLYLSPERLQQEVVQNYIKQLNVNLIAVDEAHCISQWGNDFRPAYKNIAPIRKLQPLAPLLALTATATPEVLTDTILELEMEDPAVFRNSFVRENISYQVYREDDKLYKAEQLLKTNTGAAIVYVRSRKRTVEISEYFNSIGISSIFYHGGLSTKEKSERLAQWRNNSVSTIVATNAFGMGIDHPNVRFVIHLQIPESLESYFQEAGRAGRDGEFSQAVLLYNEHDRVLVKKQYIDSRPTTSDVKEIYRRLNNYFQIPYGEGEYSKHDFNFSKFCQTYGLSTLLTYNALNTLDRLGVIQLSQEFGQKTIVQFLVSSNRLLAYFEKDLRVSIIGKTILRMYGGVFETPTAINLNLIASKTGQSAKSIISCLQKMEKEEVIDLKLQTTDASLTFIVPREDDKTINVIARDIKKQNKKKIAQVKAMLSYVENTEICRSIQLVSYFGETNVAKCGICSVCKPLSDAVSKVELREISKKILLLLKDGARDSREISEELHLHEQKVMKALRLLTDHAMLKVNIRNQFYIP